MDNQQISQEIRELADADDRHQIAVEALETKLRHLEERSIPSALSSVEHTQTGILKMVADQAGTLQSLAVQLHSMNDRLTLLEQVIDLGPDPGPNSV